MKTFPSGLQAHLDTGTTTLCQCWKLMREDGVVLGFTDHDRSLSFGGVTFEPESGFQSTEMVSELGFTIDNVDVAGALNSDRLSEKDLSAGLYDDARIEVWTVNWQDAGQRVLMRTGNLGEVTRGDLVFRAELRGLAHRLDQAQGRIFQYGCDADLGDARCGVDLPNAAYTAQGTVTDVTDNWQFTASGVSGFDEEWFTRGKLTWLTGANAGRAMEVKSSSGDSIALWQAMSEQVSAGDTFQIHAGCDKQFATCQGKFANAVNFRGFPHIPGNDFAMSYPARSDGNNDGGSRQS